MGAAGLEQRLVSLRGELANVTAFRVEGRVVAAAGLSVDIAGIAPHVRLGDRIALGMRGGRFVDAEVIAFRDGLTRAMAFGPLEGVGAGSITESVIFMLIGMVGGQSN